MGKRRTWILVAIVAAGLLTGAGCRREPARGAAAAGKPYVAAERTKEDVQRGAERILHRAGCQHAGRIGEHRRLGWDSADDARSAGYRPCRACAP